MIVAEDDPSARRVIRQTLQRAGMTVVGEAEDGGQAIDLVLKHRPDAVVMDIVMPRLDGLSATRHILERAPDQLVILVSCSEDEEIALASLRAGAAGVLCKDLAGDALPRAIAGAVGGEAAISRRLVMSVLERVRGADGTRPRRSR